MIRDLCRGCLSDHLGGFARFGTPPETEIEWFNDDAREAIDSDLLAEVDL